MISKEPTTQTANRSSIKPHYDVAVVGAGPGGCTAAAILAEAGHSVLLVDRDAVPRFHVGESLMPETYWSLKRLGVWDKLTSGHWVRKNGVQFVNHHDKESRPFFFSEHDPRECAETFHVRRDEFDRLLFDNARQKGADCFDHTRVVDIVFGDAQSANHASDAANPITHSLRLQPTGGESVDVSARVIVDATGQTALLANRLGLIEINPELKKAAIWTYYQGAARNGELGPEVTVILHTTCKRFWFWYIPLSDGTVSIGLVGNNDEVLKRGRNPAEVFDEEMANCPGLQRRLIGATCADKHYVAKEFSYTTRQHAGDGWVLVGDAFGFIDPIYSSGVFLALVSAERAADAIIEGLAKNDVSARQLGGWTRDFNAGVVWIRKLVQAFYTQEFSFGEFMKKFPEHGGNLTDLLVGKVFEGDPGRIFGDMDPWIESIKQESLKQ